MSRHVEKLGSSVHTKCQYQVTVLGTDPVLEIYRDHFTTLKWP